MKTKIKKILLFLAVVMLFAVLSCFNASALDGSVDCEKYGHKAKTNFSTGEISCIVCDSLIAEKGKIINLDIQTTKNFTGFYIESSSDNIVLYNCESTGFLWSDQFYCKYRVDLFCYEVGECSVTLIGNDGYFNYVVDEYKISVVEHKEELIPAKNPTCTEKGLTEGKKCSICGAILAKQEEISELGHKEEIIAGKSGPCIGKGLTDGKKCSVCGVIIVEQKEIPGEIHEEEIICGKSATCNDEGLTDGKKCSACGIIIIPQIEIPIEGHNYEETYVEPTCIKDGYLKYVCVDCGDTEQNELTATGHTETTLKAVTPTYTKTGLTEGKKCKVCGKITVKQKKVAKKKLKKVTISSVKSTKKATVNVGWKKVTDASGYIIEYSTSKKFTKKTTKTVKIKKGKTVKTTLKKLKSGKKYYVRIRAYKTVSKKTVYGSYSSVKTVKVK